jgi:hypothetical protein
MNEATGREISVGKAPMRLAATILHIMFEDRRTEISNTNGTRGRVNRSDNQKQVQGSEKHT